MEQTLDEHDKSVRPHWWARPWCTKHPLWLPRGSVRALIALGVIGVWAALEAGAVGNGASDAVRAMAIGVAAGYGLIRHSAGQREQPESNPPSGTANN